MKSIDDLLHEMAQSRHPLISDFVREWTHMFGLSGPSAVYAKLTDMSKELNKFLGVQRQLDVADEKYKLLFRELNDEKKEHERTRIKLERAEQAVRALRNRYPTQHLARVLLQRGGTRCYDPREEFQHLIPDLSLREVIVFGDPYRSVASIWRPVNPADREGLYVRVY